MKQYSNAEIISQERLADGIYSIVLAADAIAKQALPGQFVCIYSDDGAHLLPRPISICDADKETGTIRLVYRVAGFGTDELSHKEAGAAVRILGPIGTGYEQVAEGRERPVRVLIGGGIGIPPMLLLAKEWSEAGYEVHTVLGFRNRDRCGRNPRGEDHHFGKCLHSRARSLRPHADATRRGKIE